jgi:hypothetical protein
LGNIYLHYVLDLWFTQEVQPRLRGPACLIRYADDFVICLEHREDAERVRKVLPQRLQRYGLTLHPDKSRLVPFRRPSPEQQDGKGPATFDFLGFTLYWRRTRWGRWRLGCKTRRARLGRAIQAVYAWCRGQRHEEVAAQHAGLRSRLQGHYNYVRGQWEPEEFGLSAVARPSGVVQMAEPSQPADALDVGEVPGFAPGFSPPESSGRGADLGMSERET